MFQNKYFEQYITKEYKEKEPENEKEKKIENKDTDISK